MTNIEIIHGDSINEMKRIKSKTVDLIISDPPYNLGKNYNTTLDNLDFNSYMNFSKDWIYESHRILKDNGTLYVFMGIQFISYVSNIAKDCGFKLNNWITWHYTQGIGKRRGFSARHDDILMLVKNNNFTFNLDDIRIPQKCYRKRNNMKGANPGDVWQFSHIHYCNANRQKHPTQKPEGLYERMILASSNQNDLIIDPFSGSGTCARVCQQISRNCISYEINEDYVLLSRKRLTDVFNGFDSIDPRMKRVPLNLNDDEIKKNIKRYF